MTAHKKQNQIFHKVLKSLSAGLITNKHLLVAVSGGMDSMSLLNLLLELKNILKLKISTAHVHHGSLDTGQKSFQDKAFQTVKEFCQKQSVDFYPHKLSPGLKSSEAFLRDQRYSFFKKILQKKKIDYLVLAHTEDDLLETRLLRLIRGAGAQGVTAMQFKKNNLLRPFLECSRAEIRQYAKSNNITWCEDPSNKNLKILRNWIRRSWLKALEKRQPGAMKSLARSLKLTAGQSLKEEKTIEELYNLTVFGPVLSRKSLAFLPEEDKKKILARYMRKHGFKNYSSFHIQEFIKQMDRPQKQFSFLLLGKKWEASYWHLAPKGEKRK